MMKNNTSTEDITGVQYNFLRDEEADITVEEHEINYDTLITLQEESFAMGEDIPKEGSEKFTEEFNGISFYCRDCKHLVEVERLKPTKRQKVKFKCEECGSKSIFYGTKRGIEAYFHLK